MKYPRYPSYKPSGVEWLGEVPTHWDVKRGRFAIRVNPSPEKLHELAESDEVSFVPMEAVGEYGGLDLERTKPIFEIGSGYTEFEDGDVVVAKITPCFENGKGALAEKLANGVAFGTTELHVLRTKEVLDERYLFYLTISHPYRKLGEAEMYGAGGQKRVPPEFTKNLRIPLPELGEQQTIANFLDAQTTRIDTLIEKKHRLIEKLKEKRAALITRTVTRGLPPEAAAAAGLDPNPKLKPSGIDWLGDVPEHWDVLPFTKYLIDKSDYRGATPEKVPDGIFLVTAKNVRMGYIDYETSQEYVREEDYKLIMRRGLPKIGDILFTTEAPLGNIALVDREGVALAQRIIRFRLNPDRFNPQFVLFAMMADAFQSQLMSLSTGSTAEGIKASKLPILRIIAPPLPEQNIIVRYISEELRRIDAALDPAKDAIDKLQEYRSALITAAVTGKIDVRGLAA
ncbi:MAG TPA: restriction endonuclease subunit S [Devosia sp.]|nr:restriction endonuclease subunit S [Devosia sp.]